MNPELLEGNEFKAELLYLLLAYLLAAPRTPDECRTLCLAVAQEKGIRA